MSINYDQDIAEIRSAIATLNQKIDSMIVEKVERDWVNVETLASILGITVQGVHYRLFNTVGVEPEKDFVRLNGKYYIKPSTIERLKR